MALILPPNYHKITAVERNRISWIKPEKAERQDIRPLRIGILNIMPLGKQYEFNLVVHLPQPTAGHHHSHGQPFCCHQVLMTVIENN